MSTRFLSKTLLFVVAAFILSSFSRAKFAENTIGYYLSPAGDVNGDGYSDVLVSVYNNIFGVSKDGKVQLFLGTGNGIGTAPAWTSDGKGGTNYGESIGSAGDVNGDGYYDVIIGAPRFSNGEENEGAVFVYYGSPSGLETNPSWIMEGNQANAFFGASVSTAGDVNKDGYADVVVGASFYDNGETNEGRIFVYLGASTGLAKTPYFMAESDQVNAYFGKSVSAAGDVNHDGFGDIVVGAPGYDHGQANEGRAYLYLGTYGGMTQAPAWTGESNQADANFGNSVACAGDLNGDGFSDVVVGANRYDDKMSNVGKLYVYMGSANGFSLYPDWTMTGSQIDGNLGISVNAAGDINGDGFGELIAGAYSNNVQDPIGNVFIYYGSRTGVSANSIILNKERFPGVNLGLSVASAGDINGDGYADIMAGVSSTGQDYKLTLVKGSAKGLATRP